MLNTPIGKPSRSQIASSLRVNHAEAAITSSSEMINESSTRKNGKDVYMAIPFSFLFDYPYPPTLVIITPDKAYHFTSGAIAGGQFREHGPNRERRNVFLQTSRTGPNLVMVVLLAIVLGLVLGG